MPVSHPAAKLVSGATTGLRTRSAMDIDSDRLQKVTENLERLGLTADPVTGDATHPPTQLVPVELLIGYWLMLPARPAGLFAVTRCGTPAPGKSDVAQLVQLQVRIPTGLWPTTRPSYLVVRHLLHRDENSQVVTVSVGTWRCHAVAREHHGQRSCIVLGISCCPLQRAQTGHLMPFCAKQTRFVAHNYAPLVLTINGRSSSCSELSNASPQTRAHRATKR